MENFIAPLGYNSPLSPLYLLCFLLVAVMLYLRSGSVDGFWAFVLPRAVWSHRSTSLDVALFVVTLLMRLGGLTARLAAAPVIAAWVMGALAPATSPPDLLGPVALALLVFVLQDFALYWIHRAHHRIAFIWPLHAVHHSARVLTPITAYRQHPLATLLSTLVQTLVTGLLFGLVAGLLAPRADLAVLAGANAFLILAHLTVSNFHHSHFAIRFPAWLERIVISPAQHQVHHSTDPRHFDRNFGETLALWDWLFGTLYLSRAQETVSFGLTGQADAALRSHTVSAALLDPLRRIMRMIRR